MPNHLLKLCCALLLLSVQFQSVWSQSGFLENGGQWPDAVQYDFGAGGGRLFLESDRLLWNFLDLDDFHGHGQPQDGAQGHEHEHELGEYVDGHAYAVRFVGAEQPLQFQPYQRAPHPGYKNFFRGKDRSRWASGLKTYPDLAANWSEGVKLVLREQAGRFKYEFHAEPGADLRKLKLEYEGLEKVSLKDGKLQILTSFNRIVEEAPVAWQIDEEGRHHEVRCEYRLRGKTLTYAFPDGLNPDWALVIDPATWIFGSYSGSTDDNWGFTATYDNDGNLFGAGMARGAGYPTTLGAYQESWAGGTGGIMIDVAITKFSSDGTTNLWSSYLGGTANEIPHSMITNALGDLWVFGTTGSDDFPITAGAVDSTFAGGSSLTVTAIDFGAGSDIYVSRLSADGTTLMASTYMGGSERDGLNLASGTSFNYGDHARGSVYLDAFDNAYIASCTNSGDFPVSPGAFQTVAGGGQDGVVFSLNPDMTVLRWSSFLGGASADGAYSIITSDDDVIVAGGTTSSDFPVTSGTISDVYGGIADGFLVRLSPDGVTMEAGSFLGTPDYDQVYFTVADDDGALYVTGQTRGNWPILPTGVYSNPLSGQFIAKIQPDLSGYEYSTVYGSGSSDVDISPTAFLVDVCGNVYISGWGGVTNVTGSTFGLPITSDALQSTTDGSDFYFSVFSRDMVGLEFATFYGGGVSNEHVDGGTSRFDPNGVIYQAVCAGCGGNSDFPTTPGSVSQTNNSTNCNLGVAKVQLDFSGVNADFVAVPAVVGCLPFTVNFINNSTGAVSYQWQFGDGSGSSAEDPTHTYAATGTYTVRLIAIDSNSCNIADTAFVDVLVHLDDIIADFDPVVTDLCDSVVVDFSNLTTSPSPAFYQWEFGDGDNSALENPSHTYTAPGSYTVILTATDPTSCNILDTASFTVVVSPRAIAAYNVIDSGCAPLIFAPTNNSVSINPSWQWDFGDGGSSTEFEPSYSYEAPGTYDVTLVLTDPDACNEADTAIGSVTVYPDPAAGFIADPEVGSFFQLISFTDQSSDAISWSWDFGDGGSSAQQNPEYQYDLPGEYEVCLRVTNIFGCTDTICSTIILDADSELTFPNAFSPNGDGVNDEFLPFNWGLETYLLRIYNRWGELIFETSSQDGAWDGTFKGVPQEVGTYKVVARGKGLDGKDYFAVSDLHLVR